MDGIVTVTLEATNLRDGFYAVRPVGRLGTCGFSPVPWTVQYIKANTPSGAVAKAKPILMIIESIDISI